ncbi:MAG: amidase [Planctomycetia bacterium]|nr:amidase [Planctomycetia bacterium]
MAARANLATISQQFKRGALRPIDLVDRCLASIKQHEPAIHAWVKVDERGARQAAQALGDELERGQSRGPLHGIPIGIKDIFDVAGWPTKAGSSLRAQHVAAEDATVVARLRAGGAILLGKTVTTEYACFDPSVTHNPWNPAHTPGGSSAGSAASVALGMCLAAVGSQTGGSITRPASYCGVAGIKPTFGLLDLGGVVPVSFHLDHAGAMARSVSDLAAMLLVMSTPTAEEGVPHDAPHVNYLAAGEGARMPRLGVIEPFFLERCDDTVKAGFRQAIDNLRQGGVHIVAVAPPTSFADLLPLHRKIMAVEAAAYHRAAFEANRPAYGKQIAGLIDEGLRMPAYEYAMAIRHLEWYREHAWDDLPEIDALVTPATTTPAPARLDTTGDPQFNSPWSYAGLPTVSIPCGLSREGLPIALQLIGPKLSELTLLSAAAWCERRLRFEAEPALTKGNT